MACKATFRLEPGPARLCSRQVPIRGVTGDGIGDRGGVDDLVPCKGSPEVLLVGLPEANAWPEPRRLVIGSVDKLVPPRPDEAWSIGPMGLLDSRRAAFASDFETAMRAWHDREVVAGVDPHFFNAAPRAQWVEALVPGETLTLWNLHADVQRLEVQVPDVRPRAVIDRAGVRRKVELQADTLLLDLEGRLGMLTFRLGVLETAGDSLSVIVECETDTTSLADVTLDLPAVPDAAALKVLPFERAAVVAHQRSAEPFDAEATVLLDAPHVAPGSAWIARPPAPPTSYSRPEVRGQGPAARLGLPTFMLADAARLGALLLEAPARIEVEPAPERVAVPEAPPALTPAEVVAPAPQGAALLPLSTCARLHAQISLHPSETAALLEQSGHTPEDFRRSERHWASEIRQESRAGRSTQLSAYDEAFVSRLEELRGPLTREDYAALVVARERGRLEPEAESRAIPPAAILRIERVWIRRLSADTALFEEVERAIRRVRSVDGRSA